MNQNAPRLRLATDIDLSKAKKSCKRCHGTGRRGSKSIEDPENEGKKVSVPIICRCVTRGGGVKEDQLDLMVREMVRQIESGQFAEMLAQDIIALPMEHRVKAISQLEADANNPKKVAQGRLAAKSALKFIRQALKEGSHGDA